jgi:hypothetical protein
MSPNFFFSGIINMQFVVPGNETFDQRGQRVDSHPCKLRHNLYDEEYNFILCASKFRRSTSLVMVDFYPFTRRLNIKGEELGQSEIDCNGEESEKFYSRWKP